MSRGNETKRRMGAAPQHEQADLPALADREAVLADLDRVICEAWASFDAPRPSEPELDEALAARLKEPLPETAGDAEAAVDDGITWLLSRELLQAGLDRPAGDGDVRLWPARGAGDGLYLHLRAPSGEALFEVSRASVAAFLRGTEALVPLGEESARLALDAELHLLLSDGGGASGR